MLFYVHHTAFIPTLQGKCTRAVLADIEVEKGILTLHAITRSALYHRDIYGISYDLNFPLHIDEIATLLSKSR